MNTLFLPLAIETSGDMVQIPMKSYVIWLTESKPQPTTLTRVHTFPNKYLLQYAMQHPFLGVLV